MSVNKLERLLNLTAVLLNTSRPLTAEQIRTRVEGYPPAGSAFHRAFERDKDDLRVMGIPLTVERVQATDPPIDGYRIDPEEYYLPDPGLDPEELAALHLASLSIRLDGLDDQEALWKLGGVSASGSELASLNGSGDNGLMQGVVANLPTDPALIPIFQAITAEEAITFGYRSQRRTVDPWRLDFHRGRWYLTGFDHDRDDQRNFRLDRIEGEVMRTGDAIDPGRPRRAASGPLRPWEMGGEEQTVAKLLVDGSHAASAARQLGPDVVSEPAADGGVVFHVPVMQPEAFRTFVLGFLEHAEILEPVQWRSELVAWLNSAVDGPRPTSDSAAAEARS
jgi:proteasome accessory factor B